MRRLGSRVKEGRVWGMAASEMGMGMEERRPEAYMKVYTVFRLWVGLGLVWKAWGKKSHHRWQEKMSFAKAKSPVFMGNRKWGVWAGDFTQHHRLREKARDAEEEWSWTAEGKGLGALVAGTPGLSLGRPRGCMAREKEQSLPPCHLYRCMQTSCW